MHFKNNLSYIFFSFRIITVVFIAISNFHNKQQIINHYSKV